MRYTREAAADPAPRPRRWAPLVAIVLLALTAQTSSGQSPSGGRPWIAPTDRRFQERFQELLLDEPTRDLTLGWTYAEEIGRPVAPLLWGLLDAERSNVERRLALLVAALVADGPTSDQRLFALLDRPKPLLAERAMASLWIALGPARARPMPGALQRLIGPNKEPEDLLAVAARLAAARYRVDPQASPVLHAKDPGLLAAAAFAGLPVGKTVAQRLWRGEVRHGGLFRRGAMLGAARADGAGGLSEALSDYAAAVLAGTDARRGGERGAAVLLLARHDALGAALATLDWELLRLAVSQPQSAASLRSRLRPTPFARDPMPGLLAAAYAWNAPVADVMARASQWGNEPLVRGALAVALAARLCTMPKPPAVEQQLDFAEWSFVSWASTGTYSRPSRLEDARLEVFAAVLAQGRATKASARAELELALWRWGSHPGLGPWELERQLIRDLLLVGSRAGGKYRAEVPSHLRYFPTGLDRDDPFFDIAVELYEFTGRRARGVPAEHRLR